MSDRTKWIPALGFIASALAVGVPYFLIPYRELNLPSALYGPGPCVLVAAAALTLGCSATTFWKGVVIIGALCAMAGALTGWIVSKHRARERAIRS